MSGNYGFNQFPQYPGDARRTSGSSSANPSSLNNLSANQSYGQYPGGNVNSYSQYNPSGGYSQGLPTEYNPSGGYSQGLPTQNVGGGSLASNTRDQYGRPQYASELAPGGLSQNASAQPSGMSLDTLYSPMASSNTMLQQSLGDNPSVGLHHDSYLSSSLGMSCPNPSHNSDSRASHGVVRNHICPTCGKGFGRPSSLAQHEFIHTGERPYVCHVCRRAFNTTSNLKCHQSLHETDQ
ncbi:hypothetical protein PTTG_09969 [Puccinia triticina 1-1 BBBD Race 1]|uniref:C2H2-type domain-containing protein n=2 Tax=Puccinia triticina TaxID=208348 RepID=A0A180GX28_PUCT1|nr:uncharacterized protein PtA15_17A142 [Puccinia triticina]OAV97310.1 hypothetical protein PTTG_09969 [Puccinia triticina 1-1 BBBD Race 1]WAQ92660.1 hypothetical protein PtA15_17A142 [Puccinia triticina]